MDKELEEYYSRYFMLFNTDGWKQLMVELTQQAGQINSVEYTKDSDDLYFRKGQINVLASILNFESTIRRAYDDTKDQANAPDL